MGLVGAATAIDSTDILYGLDLDHLILPPRLQEKGVICRRSGIADLDLLKEWRVAFSIEALGYRDSPALHESSSELVDALHAQGDLWLLTESGRPVASAAINARLADSVTVGGVWAPPDLRGRGYARAVVGGMLEEARRSGVPRSVLFADRANPFSCRAYEALGFQAVGDYGLILFHEPHSTGVE
jgi:RimJ/RimL family protein N-acetyltransferase